MLNIPVIAQDLKDMVVIASHDGILISSKLGSSYLKPLADKVNLRPMYEQRRWGDYRVLEYKQTDESSSLVKRMRIHAGQAISYQYHSRRSEVWVVVSGKGILTIDGVDSVVSPGSVVRISQGVKHALMAATELEFIEVQLGDGELEEEDIERVL
jgi:mannose-1-phosphate guanylyltransferase